MLIIGLTGGVASGKNFVSSQLQRLKIPVFDADLEVHKLLASDREIFLAVKKQFPKSIVNKRIDRKILGSEVFGRQKKLHKLEQIIYPKLRKREDFFIKNNRRRHIKMIALNIPLLFEKGGYKKCHKTIAVIVPKRIQLHRFKNRFKDSDERSIERKFKHITSNQINNLQRKNQADFLIHNGLGKSFCYQQTQTIIKKCLQFANCKPIKPSAY